MLNTLDDYYLLKEVIRVTGYSINHYRIKFKEDIIDTIKSSKTNTNE